MAELEPDTIVDGRYRVISRLGSGGMADVYCAEDKQLGRKVALKLLHRRFAEDPGFVERFRREAQAAAGLQHPNVVSVYDRGSHDGTYYIVMEYLPGRTLKQLIREEAPIDPVRAIDITIQILKAARFAHRRGVIHRDLKPHNVMVEDDSDHIKVTDFGIARAGASDMTETGSIMGTAQYLSPEQAQGHAVSATSDLYSVGVVLYEILTGRVPFDAESAVTIALKHVSEPPVPPEQDKSERAAGARADRALGAEQGSRRTARQTHDQFIGRSSRSARRSSPPGVARSADGVVRGGGAVPAVLSARRRVPTAPEHRPTASSGWTGRTIAADRSETAAAIGAARGAPGSSFSSLAAADRRRGRRVRADAADAGARADGRQQQRDGRHREDPGRGPQRLCDSPSPELSEQGPVGDLARSIRSPARSVESGLDRELWYSTGPGSTTVPTLTGDTKAQAQGALTNGLRVGSTVTRTSGDVPAGPGDGHPPGRRVRASPRARR